jgi:SRSO17 transposase
MPEDWFADEQAEKRAACGVPAELKPQTKPKIGLDLLRRAIQRGSLPFQWVAADALYGDSPAFRDGVAELNKWYFTEIKCSTPIWHARPEVYLPEWKGRGRHPTRLRLRNPADPPHPRQSTGCPDSERCVEQGYHQRRQQGADRL